MSLMAKNEKGYTRLKESAKVGGRTSAEIATRVKNLADVLALQEGLRFQDRGVTNEALVSCVLIPFLELPYEEQLALVKAQLPRFEANVEGIPLDETRPGAVTGHGALSQAKPVPGASSTQRRRQKGA